MKRVIGADEYLACARNLREFGYSDVTQEMIREINEARVAGKSRNDMPHGIIGQFAYKMLQDWENGE